MSLAVKSYLPSPQEAAQELLRRTEASESLLAFTDYTTLNWSAGKIHRVVCAQLDRVIAGEIDRLMLLCPPQHGKSQIASRRFPAYVLGRNPTLDVIAASATAELAEGFGRDVRNCIASREYRNVFPETMLSEDSQAKGRWHTKHGGGYYAVGIGAQLYGKGGMGIIDDPFGSWADAQSELERENVWEWYRGTFYNRIRPKQPIVLIQHRMFEDDLAGRLIERQKDGGDKWEIVELPALLDAPPWPERYDRAALERIRDNTDPRQWSSLYQQNPTPEEGTFFQRDWFKFVDPKKALGNRYMTSDFAVTAEDGDYTELATHAYGDRLTLAVDGWYGQATADVWIDRAIDQFAAQKPFAFFGETGPIRRSIEPFLKRRMAERKTYTRLEWLPRTHDKPTTARALQGLAAMGKVDIADTEYGHRLLGQLLRFPGGQLDDAVDMAALMGMAIDQAHPAILAKVAKARAPEDRYAVKEPEARSWRTA
jgi:hypothetical protein